MDFDPDLYYEHQKKSSWEIMQSYFIIAGFKILDHYELANNYWPKVAKYSKLIIESPWWLVITDVGIIRIGWRKRVISIHWDEKDFSGIITEDDTTKMNNLVHAWTDLKVIEYLQTLKSEMLKQKVKTLETN